MKPSDPSTLLPDLPPGAEILVARLRSLGDIVLETPAIAALHAWRPDLRIFVLIEKRFSAALEGNPAIAGLIFSRGFFETSSEIRRHRFPVIFNQHGGPRSALLTAASGARFRVGWRGFQYSFIYNVPVADSAEFYGQPVVHTVEHRISQFYATGLPREPIPSARVYPRADALSRVSQFLAAQGIAAPYAVLQPEARAPEMRWAAKKFAEIARWLRDTHGIATVVNLSAASAPLSAEIRAAFANSAVNANNVAIIAESLPLPDLIALISQARLFIGNDSGPVHLAAACGTPAVVIYGPTNPAQWRPWQSEYRVVSTGTQFRALRGDKTVAISQPKPISAIAVDEVRSACEQILAQKISRAPVEKVPAELKSQEN
ncbi:MAG TPA: glycosyltransferase family 9 protein [Candidatus Acidoferrales bacterium]|nr:glycosyltransferase family 9 protein [Candidatus Acidoferrales bacterium]